MIASNENKLSQLYRQLSKKKVPIIKLFDGNLTTSGFIFPQRPLVEAFRTFTSNARYHAESKGFARARQTLASYYTSFGITISSENILLTAGTSEAYRFIFETLTEPGDTILAPNPSYPLFDFIADHSRITLKSYYLDETKQWHINLDHLASQVDARTRAIVLISPHNPTGHACSEDELSSLVAIANHYNIPIICDEVFAPYFWISPNACPRPASLQQANLVFTLNGISKMFALPWLKCAWIAVTGADKQAVETVVDRLETSNDTYLSCNAFAQHALTTLFDDPDGFQRQMIQTLSERHQRTVDQLSRIPQIDFLPADGGYYLTLRLDAAAADEEEICLTLLRDYHLYTFPGYFFGMQGNRAHIIFSTLHTQDIIDESCRRLKRFCDEQLKNYNS